MNVAKSVTLILLLIINFNFNFCFVNCERKDAQIPLKDRKSQPSLPSTLFKPYEWNFSTPEEQGFDSNLLIEALQEAESMPFLYSFLTIRNGSLIVERYYQGYDKNDPHNIASAAKSFLSALVGIALREHYLENLDQKMLDFFPEYLTPDLDPRKYNITLRHLLTMT
ncbi:MAG: serine hydrolase, partial [Candidatus Hodarchaeota archaeon]